MSAGKSQPGKTLFLTVGQESTLQVSHFHFHKAGIEFVLYLKFLLEVNELCCMELYENDICSVIVFFSNLPRLTHTLSFHLSSSHKTYYKCRDEYFQQQIALSLQLPDAVCKYVVNFEGEKQYFGFDITTSPPSLSNAFTQHFSSSKIFTSMLETSERF